MKKKGTIIMSILMMVMLLTVGCSMENKIKGKWEITSCKLSSSNSDGVADMKAALIAMAFSEGTELEFKKNNKVDVISFNAESEYRIKDGKIYFKDKDSNDWGTDYFNIEIDGDEMKWKITGLIIKLEKQK